MHADGVEGLKARLAERFREVQAERGLTGTDLEKRTTHNRKNVSAIRNGGRLPTRAVLRAYDQALGTGTELTDLGERIRAAQKAVRLAGLTAAAGVDTPEPQAAESDEEVSGTDRRRVIELGALSALALSTQQRMDAAVADTTLDELEADADEIARVYGSAPHAALLPEVGGRWQQVRGILDGPISPQARPRVTTLGGQFSYFLGRLAFNAGDMRSARRFTRLADMYASETREPVLLMSVATLWSSIAYHTGRYHHAAAALHRVHNVHDPYMDARVAAYEARTYAKLGDGEAARQALDRMERTASAHAPIPGETPVGPAAVAMFRSGVAITLGDRTMVEEWAPVAIEGYRRGGGDFTVEESQHADVTMALAHMAGPHRATEPEEAARIAQTVLTARPTHTVTARLRQCAEAFHPGDHKLPTVAAFLDGWSALPALPVGTSVQ
ncbi:helix-turn-helix domain-containing protein [Frankia sp. Cpl3]|nr:helix-turn-helix domain-containing protein [Frankia sp. Cpl3]